jgi:hypothetical protein
MADCKLCQWFSRLFEPKQETFCSDTYRRINDWDRSAAGDIDQWWDEPLFDRLVATAELWDRDPKAAFQSYKDLAEQNSVHAMIWLGNCYRWGHGTEACFDSAYESYTKAINAGSWLATLKIAELMFQHDYDEEGVAFLESGIERDFIPANFWLARYRVRQSWSRKTFREVRPLLETATAAGHPGARSFLAVAMILGRYGIMEIRNGSRLMDIVVQKREEAEAFERESAHAGLA